MKFNCVECKHNSLYNSFTDLKLCDFCQVMLCEGCIGGMASERFIFVTNEHKKCKSSVSLV